MEARGELKECAEFRMTQMENGNGNVWRKGNVWRVKKVMLKTWQENNGSLDWEKEMGLDLSFA